LTWLAAPPAGCWLDAGCGTGALAAAILAQAVPRAVVGVDASARYLAYARAQSPDPRLQLGVADLQALPLAAAAFDAVVSGLVLNFVGDGLRAVQEMARVARGGGLVAVYVWDYVGEMQFMRYFWEAAAALDETARALDEGVRFPLCRPEPLAALFQAAGLRDVAVRAIDIPTVFRNFDDYWQPFLGGQGPAPGYTLALSAAARAALREQLRVSLPTAADGSIHLLARAWAVRGTV
jgi:SAM-dependent methyltransferase